MVDLGPELNFPRLPAPIEIGGQAYFLTRADGEYRLLSRVCPHQGGQVVDAESCFECPQHGWRFAHDDGRGIDVPAARLRSLPVTVRDGHLWADLVEAAPWAETARPLPGAVEPRRQWPADFSVRLVGHACLEIRQGGFTLLTDPWLSGPAFLGAWAPYPSVDVDITQLRPDAIWISHEHSDHFHPATLVHFDRATPIYVPDFPNGRLARALEQLGFQCVHRMRFGQRYTLAENIFLTCFEPPGLWNDSMLLVEAGGVRLLNINDAGVNHRVGALVGPIDILASAYNPASSFPFAWSHLAPEEKEKISERARVGMLRMLHQAVKCYRPTHLLPFAAHFILWHPRHRDYLTQLRRNTLDDVVQVFRHTSITVLDMLPGGFWQPEAAVFERGPERSRLYDLDYQLAWVTAAFDESMFAAHHPPPGALARRDLETYLLRLNGIPDIAFCEDISVRLRTDEDPDAGGVDVSFQIAAGRLSIVDQPAGEANLTMTLPLAVLRHLVVDDVSWDEAHVGFWCRFTRTPDVFHAGFWRLLQAPYYLRSPELASLAAAAPVAATISVAELVARHGDTAERILSRYGLHCGGCAHAPAEPLRLAAQRHGIDEAMTDRLLREIGVAIAASPDLAGVR